jgi:hypothetical protein
MRNDIPFDEEPSTAIERIAGRSIVCECENSEYSLLFDIDSRKKSALEGEKYEIKIQENTLSIFDTYRCRKCERYPELKKSVENLKTRIVAL